ncbi:DNA cytosine methyltransferase (plasmid) [Arsenophonus sp. aPb]|uniref:DNA cytosine methyltransferase n=1 Tax=Arsenophonus sp. aPb TaxID=3041619 RepID=UPI002468B647|nr:DNA cytosine methyltransferase [Arsenophonus sp. aPb]WGL99968.1 DNA cytosine methyltransferase [Arsenophonus sp. aPb]
MAAYYNEIDPYAAQWLRNLIAAGHIANGDVDERSIEDVKPDDLKTYTQCHFFAGIGVWSYALRQAGWPDDKPVWTGSCPCQPFSAAGKGKGLTDKRHLWPAFFHLICQCKPDIIFGEQVASTDGIVWLELVQSDLEAENYTTAAIDLCAAGFGAPHIRQRLYWLADTHGDRLQRKRTNNNSERRKKQDVQQTGLCDRARNNDNRMVNTDNGEFNTITGCATRKTEKKITSRPKVFKSWESGRTGDYVSGYWENADWLLCRDGKLRPIESGTFPLAHGITSRVGRLRAYGNAIVAPVAKTFIKAFISTKK